MSVTYLCLRSEELTTLEGREWPPGRLDLHLGINKITSLKGLPPGVANLDLGSNQIETLEYLPVGITTLDLGHNQFTSLEQIWPPGLKILRLGSNPVTSFKGLPTGLDALFLDSTEMALECLPMGMGQLWMGKGPYASLKGLPADLKALTLQPEVIASLVHLPAGLHAISLFMSGYPTYDFAPLLTAAYCDVLCREGCVLDIGLCGAIDIPGFERFSASAFMIELERAVAVPVNKRPARVVLVVLSSSSVPRVGARAAVRRLHRADLVQEMAGMLG